MDDSFVYGAQYFRPPNPPRSLHRAHLENIRETLGFNTVKLFAQWNVCHPSPGTFDLEELEEIACLCEELGLHVLLQGDKLFCYCASSVLRFREWVRTRYGTLEVNRHWSRCFTEWEDVRPPFRCGTYAKHSVWGCVCSSPG